MEAAPPSTELMLLGDMPLTLPLIRRRGRPPGENYSKNKLKTDRKHIREEEDAARGIVRQEPKRQRTGRVLGNVTSEFSKAALALLQKADLFAQKHNATVTVLLTPACGQPELARAYSSNGQIAENCSLFQELKNQMNPSNYPPLIRPEVMHLQSIMEPIDALMLRRQAAYEQSFGQPLVFNLDSVPIGGADCWLPSAIPLDGNGNELTAIEPEKPAAAAAAVITHTVTKETMTLTKEVHRTQVTLMRSLVPDLKL